MRVKTHYTEKFIDNAMTVAPPTAEDITLVHIHRCQHLFIIPESDAIHN